ncbi:MAG: ATP-binding protein [Thermodesulfobacteriota bacterium]
MPPPEQSEPREDEAAAGLNEDEPSEEQNQEPAEVQPAPQEEPGRPFRLVKYFSVTGFLVILLFTLGLTIFIAIQAKSLVLKKSDDYARLLADNLNHQVFLQFLLPVARTIGRIRLRDSYQYSLLDNVINSTIHGFNVQRVNLYDVEGHIIYSTDRSLVGQEVKEIRPYMEARDDLKKHSILLTQPGSSWTGLDKTYTLRTFFPFLAEKWVVGTVDEVIGVFEIYQDLTADYRDIMYFQFLMVAISLVLSGVLFFILRFILAKGELIIEKRNEEKRRLLEQLHQAERLASLGRMVAAVSHEIRNPLGIISSTGEILQSKIKSYEPQNLLADVIVEESRRLNGVLTEFLDFARPQRPKPKPCHIESILEENLAFLALDLEKNGIEVQRSFKEPEPVEADPDQLYRAFLNIFLNAIQAMPEGGLIKVSTSLPYGQDGRGLGLIEVTVTDTGEGVDPAQVNNVFNPFFTTKNRGSGLGLAIVKNIIEGHKGTITIGPGEEGGTKVVVRVPISQN